LYLLRKRKGVPGQAYGTCLAMCGLNGHPQAWTPLCWSPALEAATHSLLILLGGSLKAEGFGDGFSMAKHIRPMCLPRVMLRRQSYGASATTSGCPSRRGSAASGPYSYEMIDLT